jgi:hypothetical protein
MNTCKASLFISLNRSFCAWVNTKLLKAGGVVCVIAQQNLKGKRWS